MKEYKDRPIPTVPNGSSDSLLHLILPRFMPATRMSGLTTSGQIYRSLKYQEGYIEAGHYSPEKQLCRNV